MKITVLAATLLFMLSCTPNRNRQYDGVYIHTDSAAPIPNLRKVTIKGNELHYSIRSLKDRTLLRVSKEICLQFPDRLEIPSPHGTPLYVKTDSAGNLLYDNRLFVKETFPILTDPIPDVFRQKKKTEK